MNGNTSKARVPLKSWAPAPEEGKNAVNGKRYYDCADCKQSRYVDVNDRCMNCNANAMREYQKANGNGHVKVKVTTTAPTEKKTKDGMLYLSQVLPVKLTVDPHPRGKAWQVAIKVYGGKFDDVTLSYLEVDHEDEIKDFGQAVQFAKQELAMWETAFAGRVKPNGKLADAKK